MGLRGLLAKINPGAASPGGEDPRRGQRRDLAMSYISKTLAQVDLWLDASRETTNFTYDLTELNRTHLAGFVAAVAGADLRRAAAAIDEIRADAALAEHVRRRTQEVGPRGQLADPAARLGRRLGWYAIARLTRPRLIVETGVEKGLGAVVLCAALARNAAEGAPGAYLGTDIDPAAGWLLTGEYARYGKVLYGDSLASLRTIAGPIDLFINDSDHSAKYEGDEYRQIAPRLGERAVVLGDNAHVTDELYRFALATGRRFLYFHERPQDHWYPGAGIGAAFGRDG